MLSYEGSLYHHPCTYASVGGDTWVTYILIDDALNLHGLHDVCDKLWMHVGIPDLLMQEGPYASLNKHDHRQTHTQLLKLFFES